MIMWQWLNFSPKFYQWGNWDLKGLSDLTQCKANQFELELITSIIPQKLFLPPCISFSFFFLSFSSFPPFVVKLFDWLNQLFDTSSMYICSVLSLLPFPMALLSLRTAFFYKRFSHIPAFLFCLGHRTLSAATALELFTQPGGFAGTQLKATTFP